MGEIVLSWVKCKKCEHEFPVTAKNEDNKTKDNLYNVPKYCPMCGSLDLGFDDLATDYYG